MTIEKSAKELMRESMFTALVEGVDSIKKNNIDNGVLRECKAIHGNTTFDDLPVYVQIALNKAVENAFAKLHSNGFVVRSKD